MAESTNNSITQWYGFYPSNPFWVVEKPELSQNLLALSDKMSQIIIRKDTSFGKLQVARDGMVLCNFRFQLSAQDILEYLNGVNILLASRASENFFKPFIDLQEVTLQDVVYHEYKGEQIAKFDIETVGELVKHRYLARFLSSFLNVKSASVDTTPGSFWHKLFAHSIVTDKRISSRTDRVMPESVFDLVASDLNSGAKDFTIVQLLSALNKSMEQYTQANYDMSLIYSWFVIEAYLFKLYEKAKPGENTEEMSSSDAIRRLKEFKAIPYQIGNDLHTIRIARNSIVHNKFDSKAQPEHAAMAIEAIKEFIKRDTGLNLSVNA